MFSLIGGGLGYLGVTKYSDISEMHKEAIYSYNDIQKTKAEVQDAKSLSDIVLDIRKFREDVMLDKDIGDLKMHELKSSGVHHHFFKKPLFKYLDKREEYEPEVRLEAIKTILDLHYKHDIELVTSEKEKILDALLGVLEATESRDWGTQLVVRKMLEKLTKDNDQLKNSISRDLKHILSDISAREHVKFNAARMLATLDVRHEKVKSLLKEKIEKEIPMRSGVNFRAITASIALIEIGDDAGLEYILNKINDGGKNESYWAAFFLGELLWVKKSDERVFEILKQRLVDKGFSNQKLTKKMKEGINYLKQQEVPLNNYYVKYFSLISEELNNSGS